MGTTYASLSDLLGSGAVNHPALIDSLSGRKLTYTQLKEEITLAARAFQAAGIKKGSIVLFLMPNTIEMVVSFLALASIDAISLVVNPETSQEELQYYKDNAEPCMILLGCHEQTIIDHAANMGLPVGKVESGQPTAYELPQALAHTADSMWQDVSLLLYTSGTTNKPKGVPLTNANILTSSENYAEAFALSSQDVSYVAMPLFHVHGLIGGTLSALQAGGTAVITPRFSASRFWGDVEHFGVTWYSASPTIHRILLKRADEDNAPKGKLRFIRSSSARLEAETADALERRFGTIVLEAYGMSEAANQVCANPLPPRKRKHSTLGLAAGADLGILTDDGIVQERGEEGEICIRGKSVMSAYFNNPEATKAAFRDGWFRTGDQGLFDADGYLCLSGRIKELINRGGEKISPLEVDEILLLHPAVEEAAAFGISDAKYGEEICAAVVINKDITAEELIAYCTEHLSPHKVPKQIFITDSLPRTPTNKVQRNLLALLFSD